MIQGLQREMLKMDQVEIPTNHKFCNGVYAREIHIPSGVALVGAKHKTSFFMVISKGECNINGVILKSPYMCVSEIGDKRAIMAITDTVLTTFHPTELTDIEAIESEIIEDEGLKIINNPKVKLL